MNKVSAQYVQLVYFYRLLFARQLVLLNLVSPGTSNQHKYKHMLLKRHALGKLLAESIQDDDHSTSGAGAGQELSLDDNQVDEKPRMEPIDCFDKGYIGQHVTGKELARETDTTVRFRRSAGFYEQKSGDDEETGYYYFGARYDVHGCTNAGGAMEGHKPAYDPKISMWISTDPALPEYLPTGKQLFFPESKFDFQKNLKGLGGIYNSFNINVYHYASINPMKYMDPDGNATIVEKEVSSRYQYSYSATALVKKGDSVEKIARQYLALKGIRPTEANLGNVMVSIIENNNLKDPAYTIKEGSTLKIGEYSLATGVIDSPPAMLDPIDWAGNFFAGTGIGKMGSAIKGLFSGAAKDSSKTLIKGVLIRGVYKAEQSIENKNETLTTTTTTDMDKQ